MSGIIKLGLSIRLQLFDWKSPLFSSVYWSLAELLWSNYVFLITERCLVGLHYGPFMRRSTWLTLLAASHDIWLFTNEWLMAWASLTLPFTTSDPLSLIQSKNPETKHIFSHRETVFLTVAWIEKSYCASTPHWPASKHAIVDSTGKGRRRRGQEKEKKKKQGLWLAVAVSSVIQMGAWRIR